nr:uncharacterized protein LOC128690180 [Cherax quadricarinatus]
MTRHPARRCHLCGRLYPQDAAHHTFSCSFCGLSVCVANVTAHRRRCVTVGAGQYSKQMIRGAGQEERDQSVSSDESSTVTLPQEQVEPIAGPSGWRPAAQVTAPLPKGSPERLEEKTLPPKRAFYSSLSKKHISQEEFDHAHLVWEKTACQTLGD